MDVLLYHPLKSTPFVHSLPSTPFSGNRTLSANWSRITLPCVCLSKSSSFDDPEEILSQKNEGRRAIMGSLLIAAASFCLCDVAGAVSTSRRALRGAKIPESEYKTLPNGLKYYDLKVGTGAEAVKGSRVAIHYVAKWRNITFMTSRQGMGVGGGTLGLFKNANRCVSDSLKVVYLWRIRHGCSIETEESAQLLVKPYGFDVGQSEKGNVLKGLDLGVQGMRVGGQRLLIVPPELAYGKKGVQEIPPNATIEMDIELLSIKQSPFGTPVKIVEG